MRRFIAFISISLCTVLLAACSGTPGRSSGNAEVPTPASELPVAERFVYPLGNGENLTAAKDSKDAWYNALNFGENDHLGEDWNKNTGGNSDCGEPVYAIASGVITYAADAGPGWGNVVIITHRLPDGTEVQSLYGHLEEIKKTNGEVGLHEQIGTVGNASGKYLCHLHLELRTADSRDRDKPGGGYSPDRTGWLDPSEFIDSRSRPGTP